MFKYVRIKCYKNHILYNFNRIPYFQIVLAAILAIAYANPAPQPKPQIIAAASLDYSPLTYDPLPALPLVRSDPLVLSTGLSFSTDLFGARLIY